MLSVRYRLRQVAKETNEREIVAAAGHQHAALDERARLLRPQQEPPASVLDRTYRQDAGKYFCRMEREHAAHEIVDVALVDFKLANKVLEHFVDRLQQGEGRDPGQKEP